MGLEANTESKSWRDWSIRVNLEMLVGICVGLWYAFNIYSKVHDNELNIDRVEGRLENKTGRNEDRIEAIEQALHDLECPPEH